MSKIITVNKARQEGKKRLTLPSPLKEKPNHSNLHPTHPHHHTNLHKTQPPNPPLRTPHRTKIPILPRAKILLHPPHRTETARNARNSILHGARVFGAGGLFGREQGGAVFVLDGDFEIDEFFVEAGGVGEAEGVRARGLRGEDVVALALGGFGEDGFFRGRGYEDVDVEGAAGLDLDFMG